MLVQEVGDWSTRGGREQDLLHPPLVIHHGHHGHHGYGPPVGRLLHIVVHTVVHSCSVPLALRAPVGVEPGGEEMEGEEGEETEEEEGEDEEGEEEEEKEEEEDGEEEVQTPVESRSPGNSS